MLASEIQTISRGRSAAHPDGAAPFEQGAKPPGDELQLRFRSARYDDHGPGGREDNVVVAAAMAAEQPSELGPILAALRLDGEHRLSGIEPGRNGQEYIPVERGRVFGNTPDRFRR